MPRYIEVIDYRQEWQFHYEKEVRLLRNVFGPTQSRIHHIGSTSVPGMKAKPIIDILIEIKPGTIVEDFYEQMRELGYDCRGECLDARVPGTPGRYYFSKDKNGKRYCQVHVCHEGHFQIVELIALRDYLREHPDRAAKYGELKCRLASEFARNNVEYMRGKDKFIKQLILEAMEWKGAYNTRRSG